MFRKILVATDGSTHSDKAAGAAIALMKEAGGTVVALSVAEPYPFPPISESPYAGGSPEYERRALELAQEHAHKVAIAAAVAQVPCQTVVVPGVSPSEEIVATASRLQCDAIFMATHGRKGLNKLFAGSETQKVIAHTPVPVMVFR